MSRIANEGLPVFPLFRSAFATAATFARAVLLAVAAILTTGRRTVAKLLRWFPERRFVLAADGNYGSHEMAELASRSRGRLHLVSKFPAKANLYEPPPAYSGHGRPRVKGAKRPSPQEVVATAQRRRLNGAWYGGGRRDVEVVSGTGPWYKAGRGLVPVRWVYVHDLTGTHRDEYLYSTDVAMTPQEIIEEYTGRWNIGSCPARLSERLAPFYTYSGDRQPFPAPWDRLDATWTT